MIELHNTTSWSVAACPGWDHQRRSCVAIVVKQGWRFGLDGEMEPLDEVPPVEWRDRFAGDPATSSVVAASEVAPFKRGGEIYLYGTAWPARPGMKAVEVKLGLNQGGFQWQKRLIVHGERRWRRGLFGFQQTPAQPLESLPLRYEYTWGGRDPDDELDSCPHNPAGCGHARRVRQLDGRLLPAIEYPGQPVLRPGQVLPPAGFGPLPVHWEPRATIRAGMTKESMQATACPYPDPVDQSIYNCAPVDQRFDQPFHGDETLFLQGMFKGYPDPVTLALPFEVPEIRHSGQDEIPDMICDTLIVDTDLRQVHRVWRTRLLHAHADHRMTDIVVAKPRQVDRVREPLQEYAV